MKRQLTAALLGATLLVTACGDDRNDTAPIATGAPEATIDMPLTERTATTSGAPATTEASTARPDPSSSGSATTVHEVRAPQGAEEVDDVMPRLAVADAGTGAVELIDLTSGASIGRFETTGPAALATDGRVVYATDYDGGAVTFIDSGSWVVDHGDHVHAYVAEPSVIGSVEGPHPAHVVPNDGFTSVFFDGRGAADVFAFDDLVAGDVAPALSLETALPHHGLVAAFAGHFGVSIPGATEEDLPVGVEVRHDDGAVEASFPDCPEMHGEAAFADGLLLACADGVLWVHGGEGEWAADKLAYPEGSAAEDRTWSFAHTPGVPVVAGVLGDDALLVVDTEAGTTQRIALPVEPVAVAVADDGEHLVTLTTDGHVHAVHIADGTVETTEPMTEPVEASAEGDAAPQPQLVSVGSRTYLSDPVAGTVIEIDHLDGLRVARTFDVSVTPARLTVTGTT